MSLLVEKFFIDVGQLCEKEDYVGAFAYYLYRLYDNKEYILYTQCECTDLDVAMACLLLSSKFLCDTDYIIPSDIPLIIGRDYDDYEQYITTERDLLISFEYRIFRMWELFLEEYSSGKNEN